MSDQSRKRSCKDKIRHVNPHAGEIIRERRRFLNKTQVEVATNAGIPQSHLSRIEKGKHKPELTTLSKLAPVLNIPLEQLIDRNQNTKIALPGLTSLQFLVISEIGKEVRSGQFLRERLKKQGIKNSLPAFYQLMARLEELNFVQGRYETGETDGYTIREKYYKILNDGIVAFRETRDFFNSHNLE